MNTATLSIVALAVLAAWTDIRTRRIPNVLTVTGFVVALSIRALGGLDVFTAGLLGAGLAFGLALPLFLVRGLGAGDVKLLAACGAFLGPRRLLTALLVTAVAGGLMALVAILRRGALIQTLRNCRDIIVGAFTPRRRAELPTLASPGAITVPYGVAIALGAIVAWFL
jgi:prepilin peptidase CpaA